MVYSDLFIANPQCNGGEAFVVETEVFECDGEFYLNQILSLQSYSNISSINLSGGMLNSKKLRELADRLEGLEKKYDISI